MSSIVQIYKYLNRLFTRKNLLKILTAHVKTDIQIRCINNVFIHILSTFRSFHQRFRVIFLEYQSAPCFTSPYNLKSFFVVAEMRLCTGTKRQLSLLCKFEDAFETLPQLRFDFSRTRGTDNSTSCNCIRHRWDIPVAPRGWLTTRDLTPQWAAWWDHDLWLSRRE